MDLLTFKPVEGLPGIVTCPNLRRYLLGIAPTHDLLCCITCRPCRPLNLSTAYAHMGTHKKKEKGMTSKKLEDLCKKYHVFEGTLDKYPIPEEVCAPICFLEIEEAFRCVLCEEEKRNYFGVAPSTRYAHFNAFHRKYRDQYESFERPVKVQSFCSRKNYSYKNYFEVDPLLTPAGQEEVQDEYKEYEASANELVAAFSRAYKPSKVERPTPAQVTLQETIPFLYYTGWAAHVSPHDPAWLCKLVAEPEENDQWRPIYDAAVRVFKEDQADLDKVLEVYRLNVMDDGIHPPNKPFRSLQDDTATHYGKAWGLWAVFLLRMYDHWKNGDHRYTVKFTAEQERCIQWAISYCKKDDNRAPGKVLLMEMACWFWRPNSPDDFEHIALDQFNDPTVRFATLLNLLPDGSFVTPRNATHNLVRVKYFIRAALFMWSRDMQQKKKLKPASMYEEISTALSRRVLCPFACICAAVAHGTTYAAMSTALPNVMWSSPNEISIEGQPINWTSFRRALSQEIIDLERHIMEKILLGIPLEECGFNLTEKTVIHDKLDNRQIGYSMFSDNRNTFFYDMKKSLGAALLRDPRGAKLHRGLNSAGEIIWDEAEVARWMGECEFAMERLAMVMHITGGQPGRGVEFALLKVQNGVYRVRGFYCPSAGRIVYVLFYNKTTGNTGRDWIVAHAVPWSVGRLFLIMHGLVNPLLSLFVERIAGSRERYVQESSGFASMGVQMKSDGLSRVVCDWFSSKFDVNIRIRLCRQLIIAAQRKFMPEAYSPIRQALQIVDAQAGHNSETAAQHYAIDASETHALAQDTIAKEMAAASRWWPVCLEPELLNEKDLEEGKKAPATIALEEGAVAQVQATGSSLSSEEVVAATVQAFMKPEVLEPLVEHLSARLRAGGRGLTGFSPADRLRVTVDHLDYLRRYTGRPNVSWTSDAQSQALVHVMRRQSSLLCVLRTGGGKSLLFGVPAEVEDGLTVAIFPLRALLLNQVATSHQARSRRPFSKWSSGVAEYPDGVVALAVEQAVLPGFATWAKRMNQLGRLKRIVIDEAHMVLTECDYRLVMHNLSTLIEHGVPLVCLTATMPPSMQGQWRELLGSPTFSVIRESTQRPNIIYHIARYASREQALFALRNHCIRYENELAPGEGILVQCRTYQDVNTVSNALSRPGYTSKMDDAEKDKILANWTTGKIPTVVSTTALGTGVHHPACRAVLHFGAPWGMVDYPQQTGRAGRDGLPALAVMFVWLPYPSGAHPDLKGYAPLLDCLATGGCIRYHMSKYIDGEDLATDCSGSGFAPCGFCSSGLRRAAAISGWPSEGGRAVDAAQPSLRQQNEWVEQHLPTFASAPLSLHAPSQPKAAIAPGSIKLSPSQDNNHLLRSPPRTVPQTTTLAYSPQTSRAPVKRRAEAAPSPASVSAPLRSPAHVPKVLVPGTPSTNHGSPPGNGFTFDEDEGEESSSETDFEGTDEDLPGAIDVDAIPDPPDTVSEKSDAIQSASGWDSEPGPGQVGEQVLADARQRKRRRIQVQSVPGWAQFEKANEDAYAPLTFPNLLRIRQRSNSWCIYCILYRGTHVGHNLTFCPKAPGLKSILTGYTHGETTFLQLKNQRLLPNSGVICYCCWWPMHKNHLHPTGSLPQSCVCKDQIPQLCWLVYCDDELRKRVAGYFKLERSIVKSPQEYWKWLCTVRRAVRWKELDSVLTNGQCVFLYVLYVLRPVMSSK